MEPILQLFGELSQILNVKKDTESKKLYKVLKKYHINSTNVSTSFREVVKNYGVAKKLEGIHPGTADGYCKTILSLGEFESIEQITKEDIKNFLNKKTAENISHGSLYNIWNVQKNFFDWCMEENIITRNPYQGVKVKFKKNQRHYIFKEDIKKIRDACETTFERAVIEFLLSTGCRRSELQVVE